MVLNSKMGDKKGFGAVDRLGVLVVVRCVDDD